MNNRYFGYTTGKFDNYLLIILFLAATAVSLVMTGSPVQAEGSAQFPVKLLYTITGGEFTNNYDMWRYMKDGNWNNMHVFVKPGESIVVSNFANPTVVYPDGTSRKLSGSAFRVEVTDADVSENGGIYIYRPVTSNIGSSWDITVYDANGNPVPGRVFTNGFAISNGKNPLTYSLYVLTDDGIIFNERLENGVLWWASILATKKGIWPVKGDHAGDPLHHTVKSTESGKYRHAYPKSAYYSVMPDYSLDDSVYKWFFNYPDAAVLEYLGLSEPRSNSLLRNFEFNGIARGVAEEGKGGVFSFDADDPHGNYQLYLDFGDETRNILLGDTITSGHVEIVWNGKDKLGNTVTSGTYEVRLMSTAGETHFLIDDFEKGGNGWTITQMNGIDAGSSLVYYDNSKAVIYGYSLASLSDGQNHSVIPVDSATQPVFPTSVTTDQVNFDLWVQQVQSSAEQLSISLPVVPTGEVLLRDIFVEKQWEDDENRDNLRPASILFNLYADSIADPDNPYEITEEDGWGITITDKPAYNIADGSEINYTVEELTSP